jgi:hypothetical protein
MILFILKNKIIILYIMFVANYSNRVNGQNSHVAKYGPLSSGQKTFNKNLTIWNFK